MLSIFSRKNVLKACSIGILICISMTIFVVNKEWRSVSNEIEISIKELCADRLREPGDFTIFSDKLMSLGIIRQTYDVLEDSLYFYSKNERLYYLPVSEIAQESRQSPVVVGDILDEIKVRNAINKLDEKKLTVLEFHSELARAGVVYISVFLNTKKIYYFGQDGRYFLETY